jgi:hypothetical protein
VISRCVGALSSRSGSTTPAAVTGGGVTAARRRLGVCIGDRDAYGAADREGWRRRRGTALKPGSVPRVEPDADPGGRRVEVEGDARQQIAASRIGDSRETCLRPSRSRHRPHCVPAVPGITRSVRQEGDPEGRAEEAGLFSRFSESAENRLGLSRSAGSATQTETRGLQAQRSASVRLPAPAAIEGFRLRDGERRQSLKLRSQRARPSRHFYWSRRLAYPEAIG